MHAVRSSLGCFPAGQTSHDVPAYPTAQAQANASAVCVQLPPLLQGDEAHKSVPDSQSLPPVQVGQVQV